MKRSMRLDALFERARILLDSTLSSPTILTYLEEFGYDLDRIQGGRQRYEAAWELQLQQQREYGEQIGATAERDRLWETANATYIKFVKIARIAFRRDGGVATQLGLNGPRRQSLSGWLMQAQQFYGNALGSDALLAGLANFGVTPAKLAAGKAEVDAVAAADLLQEKEKGEAQEATRKRDAAIDALEEWLGDFSAIVRIALEPEPQLLESLGIKEPSEV
jgi:hypothetical protein